MSTGHLVLKKNLVNPTTFGKMALSLITLDLTTLSIITHKIIKLIMDKLQLTGQNLGGVFNSRSGCMCAMHLCFYEAKQPNLKLKTWPKQLLGSLPITFALSALKIMARSLSTLGNLTISLTTLEMVFSITTLSIMTLSLIMLDKLAIRLTTFRIMEFSITTISWYSSARSRLVHKGTRSGSILVTHWPSF
jgi:hypothetical protein